VDKFLKETGLDQGFRFEPPEDTRVVYHGVKSLWKGETDPAALESAERIDRELKRIYDEAYPEIPWSEGDPLSFEQLKALDKQNAQDWLRAADPGLHPHVEEYFQLYCWSSFGGSLEELSAAQFINFVAAETVGIRAFPAGNSAITARLHEKLSQIKGCLASNSIVLEVKETANGVEVLYEDATGALKLIHAETAIVATPKYVASAIVKGADHDLVYLWRTNHYRAYLVINVLLKEKAHSAAYDLFCLKGEVPEAPRFADKKRPWCDFIFADWAASDQSGRSILTIYKPLPFEGGKSTIVDTTAHNRIQEEATRELPALLRDLGLPEDGAEATRVTRWGHALPLAKTGAIFDGTVEKLSAPLGKIFFANQDNYLNAAFESSFAAAERAAAGVRGILGG
jgi:hypothetical protein